MRFALFAALLSLVGCQATPPSTTPVSETPVAQKRPSTATATPLPRGTPSATPSKNKPDWAILDEEEAPPLPHRPAFRPGALESDTYARSLPPSKLRTGKSDANSRDEQRLSRIAWSGSRADYREVDAKVAALPDDPKFTVETLAAALGRLGRTPEQKLRAIYRWEAAHLSYDDGVLQGGPVERSQWPTDVLRSRVAVCDGFARLYCALAQEMGLECETLLGYAEGPLVLHGKWGSPNHRWVRVRLSGGWALVDPTWAQAWQGKDRWVYQDQYFLMDPREMLKDHWPAQLQWQLLTPPLSFEAFAHNRRKKAIQP